MKIRYMIYDSTAKSLAFKWRQTKKYDLLYDQEIAPQAIMKENFLYYDQFGNKIHVASVESVSHLKGTVLLFPKEIKREELTVFAFCSLLVFSVKNTFAHVINQIEDPGLKNTMTATLGYLERIFNEQ